jgi:hypothetical protein
MRSVNGLCELEKEAVISSEPFEEVPGVRMALSGVSMNVGGIGVSGTVRIASGECCPLQHLCPGSGVSGATGMDSWQPEPAESAMAWVGVDG